ncbi:hypothetical protein [Microbacterium capsulatum]|uniref:RNA polymerase sigma-70 region 2 domain-containing protein n=1 Tax=Microbacterium capsulatum TaxID=3041921 RepID=A0ABU0XIW4_9MICO|nr:hypothetical protein [Microbacterium sp. ASV81]MDQ4215072.1 hypothetical protein [Microbacterium sp. ASV81]
MGDASWTVDADAAEFDWVARLTGTGLERDDALRRLHALMVRAARQQLRRMSGGAAVGGARAEEIVQSSADEAVVSVLARLGDFEGRSRFTTWAYKFALLQTATTVRREVWNRREVRIDSIPEPVSVLDEPSELAPRTR